MMENKRTKTFFEEMDRISELPEPILNHVLSFLSFKEVVQSSVLSKRWEKVWLTCPVLEFDEKVFNKYLDWYEYRKLNKHVQRRRNALFNCLTGIMRNYRDNVISIKKFTMSLFLSDDRAFTSFVNHCIYYAIGCNVSEIKLLFRFVCGETYKYNLPQIVLFAKSLEVLELQGCNVGLPTSDHLKLSSLRKLCLSNVRVDDRMIENLVGGCPLIEYLNFNLCEGFKCLELFGLTRLYEIKLFKNYEIEWLDIKALNVRSLEITRTNVSHEIDLSFCKNLTRLMLCYAPITDEWLCDLILQLPVLKFLSISCCYKLKTIEISSCCLEELDLCEYIDCNWIELKIDTPNLRSLSYRGTVLVLSLNASALSKINLHFLSRNVETQKYIKFLANFHHFSQVLDLEIVKSENVMVPRELRQTLSSPLSSVKLLNLRFRTRQNCYSIAKIVDGLLWFAPHIKTILIKNGSVNEYSFKFTYKKQPTYEGETASCCKSLPIKCWNHCMEAVNVEFNEVSNIIRYSLSGARIWEKIVALCKVWELINSD
ncbi:hypothetical protein Ddye_028904 [Dipteronia dyeriana]|uniref:F-box domain-containing protein n=1 Tax=Dipteronia dyeriana TaxID=168575 RepID=A0AAD9WL02_9ROSI|nr:hypothetical protein Ddye_028904 [Dipteronia dyeriana]